MTARTYVAVFSTVLALPACTQTPDACFTATTTTATTGQIINQASCAANAEKVLWDFGDGATLFFIEQ